MKKLSIVYAIAALTGVPAFANDQVSSDSSSVKTTETKETSPGARNDDTKDYSSTTTSRKHRHGTASEAPTASDQPDTMGGSNAPSSDVGGSSEVTPPSGSESK